MDALESLTMDFQGGKPAAKSLTSPSAQRAANKIQAQALAVGPGGKEHYFLREWTGKRGLGGGGGVVLRFQLQSPAHPTSLALVSAALLQCRGLCLAWKPLAVLVIRLRVRSVVLPPLCTPQTIVRLCR